jgi:hypothetical protein
MRTFDNNEALSNDETIVGGITITKVIKQHESIIARQGEENTIGELVDRQLAQLAVNGDTIQELEIGINPEYWTETLGRFYRDSVAPQFGTTESKRRK